MHQDAWKAARKTHLMHEVASKFGLSREFSVKTLAPPLTTHIITKGKWGTHHPLLTVCVMTSSLSQAPSSTPSATPHCSILQVAHGSWRPFICSSSQSLLRGKTRSEPRKGPLSFLRLTIHLTSPLLMAWLVHIWDTTRVLFLPSPPTVHCPQRSHKGGD